MAAPIGEFWQYLRWPVTLAFWWWGGTWLAVAAYYMDAGWRQWHSIRGDARFNRLTIWGHGVLMMTLAGLVRLREGKFTQPYRDNELTHTLSMTLQQGIVCSAFTSAAFGLVLWSSDRSAQPVWVIVLTLCGVMLSTVGGMIHLYPPMRPRRIVVWRCMMLMSWLGFGTLYLLTLAVYLLAR